MSYVPYPKQATAKPASVTALDFGMSPPITNDTPQTSSYTLVVGQRFGEYELLSEIARGGMGIVYRARHVKLDRIVALKMILAGRLANEEEVERFRTEAEAAANLRHPNIVAVHDVGEHDGQQFFTMEYIEGTSLDRKLAHGPLASKAAARYVRILARGVHYAHKQGILHRDLKPSNILIDLDDEPHISDFGLAKRLGLRETGHTRTGAILGTPSYMAPEQAQGKITELGPACDIYSLGAILYELVTGRPPFRAETPLDTVMQVVDHQPVPPRLLNPKIDHDLETICLKCLEKDPRMRYASAEELGDDLERFIAGDSINARSFNVIDRLTRILERDTNTANFSTWSSMILVMAAVVLFEHVLVYWMVASGQPRAFIMGARTTQFCLLGFLFWHNRRTQLFPTNAAERVLWTIWIGYFLAYFFIIAVTRLLTFRHAIESGYLKSEYFEELLPYPFIALVSGLAFFIMGSNYWGRCYAFGLAFFVAAPLISFNLALGPLIFGALWAIALGMLGQHLRTLGRKMAEDKLAANSSDSQPPTVVYKDTK